MAKNPKENSNYLLITKEAIIYAAEESEKSEEEVKQTIKAYFWAVKKLLNDERMPTVRIGALGDLKVSLKKLRQSLRDKYKKNKAGRMRDDTVRYYIGVLWPIRKRRQQEEDSSKLTYNLAWRRVDPNWTQKDKKLNEYREQVHKDFKNE